MNGLKRMPGRPLILVNESDQNVRDFLAHILKITGYRVVVGQDGQRALQLCRNLLPDLLIMNVLMEKLHAGQVYDRLRKDPETDTIKVLLLAARPRGEAYCPGADGFLAKPFSTEELIRLVAGLVGPPPEEEG